MVGNNGSSDISIVPIMNLNGKDLQGLHLLKLPLETFHNHGRYERKFVHSRNMVLYGELISSQYYGTCKLR